MSGRLDSLEHRTRQASEQTRASTDCRAGLVQDEVARREQKKRQVRLRRARFRSPKPREPVDFDFNPGVNRALIQDWATGRCIRETVAGLIAGPCGTGHSPLAQALGQGAIQPGDAVRFTTHSPWLGSLQAARATGSYERRFQTLARVPLLILEDFGLKPLRGPPDQDVHDLIAQRDEPAATLITRTLEFRAGSDAFPNRLLGAATLDRLRHNAYRLILEGQRYRAPKPLPDAVHAGLETPSKSPTKGKVVTS